jgi:hypothetical protein
VSSHRIDAYQGCWATPYRRLTRPTDPPSTPEFTWGDDILRFELRPEGTDCVLTMTATFDERAAVRATSTREPVEARSGVAVLEVDHDVTGRRHRQDQGAERFDTEHVVAQVLAETVAAGTIGATESH